MHAGAGPSPDPVTPINLTTNIKLVAFDDCDSMLEGLREAAVKHAQTFQVMPMARAEAADSAARDNAQSTAASGNQTHSSTNVHEAGVDEPDLVKTDGDRVITVNRGVLRVIDAESRKVTGTLRLVPDELGLDRGQPAGGRGPRAGAVQPRRLRLGHRPRQARLRDAGHAALRAGRPGRDAEGHRQPGPPERPARRRADGRHDRPDRGARRAAGAAARVRPEHDPAGDAGRGQGDLPQGAARRVAAQIRDRVGRPDHAGRGEGARTSATRPTSPASRC